MRGRAREAPAGGIRIPLTPLVDVSFLLLVFFLLNLRFTSLERKLAAWLPRDRGIWKCHGVHPVRPPRVDIVLRRTEAGPTRVRLADRDLGEDEFAFVRLAHRLTALRVLDPDLVCVLGTWADVPHGDVIRAVDRAVEAGITDITFRGAPPPSRLRRRGR